MTWYCDLSSLLTTFNYLYNIKLNYLYNIKLKYLILTVSYVDHIIAVSLMADCLEGNYIEAFGNKESVIKFTSICL